MRVVWKHGDRSFEIERAPMPPEKFNVLAKLAEDVIGGAVLLALVRMLDVWGLVWAVGALVLVGLGRMFGGLMK